MSVSEQPAGDDDGEISQPTDSIVYVTRQDAQSVSLNGLFIIAVLYTLYFASALFIPLTLAVLLTLLLGPAVGWLERRRIPRPLGAAVIVVLGFLFLGSVAYGLTSPAQQWLNRLPQGMSRIEAKIAAIKKPFAELQKASEKIEHATNLDSSTSRPLNVEIERPGITEQLFSGTLKTLASLGILVLLLYFLLSSGDAFLRKLVNITPSFKDKRRAIEIARSIEEDISAYLIGLTAINLALGILVGLAAFVIGIPNPVLWGALATLMSFAPYAGSVITASVLTLVGMTTFDSWLQALALPSIFLIIAFIASNVVLPHVLGRRLTLSPLAIFVSIMCCGWLWGAPGALLAVPLLASIKIVCERVDPLTTVAEFLTP